MEKEKITLTGVNETLLVPLYARALESKKENHLFYDATAVHIVDSLDYDFEKHGKSRMNMWGCAARTVLFDQQAAAHIKAHPDCSVINLACGLDDRFHRVDNGRIHWYNVDLEDVMALRKDLVPGDSRVTDITCSAFDYHWMEQVANKDHALIIAEGFLMYVTQEQVRALFDTVAETFPHTTLLLELMSQWLVDHQRIHDTTKKINVSFVWGVQQSSDFVRLCPQYKMTAEYNFTDGMKHFAPIRMSLASLIMKKKNNRLACFELQ